MASFFSKKLRHFLTLHELNAITVSPTMLHDDCFVWLTLVAYAKNSIANKAKRQSQTLIVQVAIFLTISCRRD